MSAVWKWAQTVKCPASQIDGALKKIVEEDPDITITSIIIKEILTDEDNDTVKLLEAYKASSDVEKAAIDGTLILITGWSLSSLLEKMGFPKEKKA